jgi:streptogramin lyase
MREDIASRSFPIAAEAQGAAFDRRGNLWMTFSSSKHGELQRDKMEVGSLTFGSTGRRKNFAAGYPAR